MNKIQRENVALILAAFSTVAAMTGVAVGLQARNDVIASTKYNLAIAGCQQINYNHRKFYLKLINSDQIPFAAYFPGEETTFQRAKIELLDGLTALAYTSSEFEDVTQKYKDSFSKFDEPFQGLNFQISKFGALPIHKDFLALRNPDVLQPDSIDVLEIRSIGFSKVKELLQQNSKLVELHKMPSELHEICNKVLSAVRN
ncbi:MAG: hypothetical protein ACSHXI_21675 [Hoeflea sp.]|uniref:hypothetical protein n=1 Tax=Hoeflea sp. TaxID=1940281 RepID=UPI003EF0C259